MEIKIYSDAIEDLIRAAKFECGTIDFKPKICERKNSSGNICLPERYVAEISKVQKTKELACITAEYECIFLPNDLHRELYGKMSELYRLGEECSFDIAKRLEEPWKSFFIADTKIIGIGSNNRIHLPKDNPLRMYEDIVIEGFKNYFTMRGE